MALHLMFVLLFASFHTMSLTLTPIDRPDCLHLTAKITIVYPV
jgi:hypothetical protein